MDRDLAGRGSVLVLQRQRQRSGLEEGALGWEVMVIVKIFCIVREEPRGLVEVSVGKVFYGSFS